MAQVRAIVADDDPELLAVVSLILDLQRIDVVRASTGGELLEKLANDGPFDLIVTDVSMPWMTGLHVVHSVRAAGSSCPVIVMTALRDKRTNHQVSTLGADVLLLRKPFSIAELRAALLEMVAPPWPIRATP